MNLEAICSSLTRNPDGIWHLPGGKPTSFTEGGHSECFDVEDNSFWFAHRNNCIVELINAFPPPPGAALLDVGGGNGYVAAGISQAGYDVVLVEPGDQGTRNARKRGLERVICGSLDASHFKESSVGGVGLFDVLEHIVVGDGVE